MKKKVNLTNCLFFVCVLTSVLLTGCGGGGGGSIVSHSTGTVLTTVNLHYPGHSVTLTEPGAYQIGNQGIYDVLADGRTVRCLKTGFDTMTIANGQSNTSVDVVCHNFQIDSDASIHPTEMSTSALLSDGSITMTANIPLSPQAQILQGEIWVGGNPNIKLPAFGPIALPTNSTGVTYISTNYVVNFVNPAAGDMVHVRVVNSVGADFLRWNHEPKTSADASARPQITVYE